MFGGLTMMDIFLVTAVSIVFAVLVVSGVGMWKWLYRHLRSR